MNIIKKRRIFLSISGVLILTSILLLVFIGLKLSIDFTGGSRLGIKAVEQSGNLNLDTIEKIYIDQGISVKSIQESNSGYIISSESISEEEKDQIIEKLNASEESFEVLGPTIGAETRDKAFLAIVIAIFSITLYIAIAFWKSGGVISSWKFGVSAIIALVHDVIITLGAFSLFGILYGVEIDALFVTAILTIMGFSVHDTIVVFDRIRENITNNVKKQTFEELIDLSIMGTIGRSLNTSVTVVFVLFSMVLFGGESIRWFVVAFIIGVIVGTYSSIFIAAPILLEWYSFDKSGGMVNLKLKIKKLKKTNQKSSKIN